MVIGIPEGLFFFRYYPLWESFFKDLGAEVILSGTTNKKILDLGVKLCVDEACLPVKVYHGHVDIIKERVDAVFIPRIMSISRHEYICPKFCGLPEMIKNSVPDMPEIIDTTINLRNSERNATQAALDAGSFVTKDRKRIMRALRHGLDVQREFEKAMRACGDFFSVLNSNVPDKVSEGPKIALIGHPYILYDGFLNMDIFRKLHSEGYTLLTPQMVDNNIIDKNAAILGKRHFWTLGREILGAGLNFISDGEVDGVIYLSSFCCGIDSLMEDYLERRIGREGSAPYMKLVLDEHSGEAGFDTRLEAFLDMIKWRKEHESNISTHGRDIYSSQGLS